MKHRTWTKALSLLLILSMVLSLAPAVFATERADAFVPNEDGTRETPVSTLIGATADRSESKWLLL